MSRKKTEKVYVAIRDSRVVIIHDFEYNDEDDDDDACADKAWKTAEQRTLHIRNADRVFIVFIDASVPELIIVSLSAPNE